jgi:hypothetical protein
VGEARLEGTVVLPARRGFISPVFSQKGKGFRVTARREDLGRPSFVRTSPIKHRALKPGSVYSFSRVTVYPLP